MPVKIKKRLRAITFMERAKPNFFRLLKRFIKDEIISAIESGRSPVNQGGTKPEGSSGKLRYKEYSDSYKDQMGKNKLTGKKKRPVNLKVTGRMLNSIKYKVTREAFVVWFTSPIAKYHDKLGASKKKVFRRLLPHDGEQFNAGIRKRIQNALAKAIQLSKR